MGIAFRSSSSAYTASGNSVTVTAPSGIQNGDILIAMTYLNAGGSMTITPPSGWTEITNFLDNGIYTAESRIYYKRASSESGDYTWGAGWSTRFGVAIAVFSGCISSGSPADVYASDYGTGTSHAAPSITTTVANTMLLAMLAADSSTTGITHSAPSGYSVAVNATEYSKPVMFYKNQASIGATGTATITISSSVTAAVRFHIALKPAPDTNFFQMF